MFYIRKVSSFLIGIFIMSVLLFIACNRRNLNEENVPIISLNPDEARQVNLSEFVDSIIYIKLETSISSLSGIISDIIIRKKYIYLNDISQKSVLIFDKQGKYVTKLSKQGKGYGEYLSNSAIFVDSLERYIEIFDGVNNKILTYENISFELSNSRKTFHIASNTVKKHQGYFYHSTHRIDNVIDSVTKETTNADIIVCANCSIKAVFFPKKIITNHSYYSIFPESFIINDNNELFASVMYDNTFYKINKLEVTPYLSVNFLKHGINNDDISLESTEKQIKFISSPNNLNKAFLPFLTINNEDVLSFSYCVNIGDKADAEFSFPIEFRTYIYFKKNNKQFNTRKIINDLTDFPNEIWLMNFNKSATVYEPWHGKYLVSILSPSFELKDRDFIETNCIGKVNIDDNPIIMLLKYKTN